MTMTKTCALWNEQRRQHEAMDAAMEKQVREEFPTGTRIRWVYSYERETRAPIYREGTVKDYGYGSNLIAQMKAGGATHRVPAYQADLLDAPDAAGVALPHGGGQ